MDRAIVIDGVTRSVEHFETGVRGAATWFWWIAALSVVNSIAAQFRLDYNMVLGLGLTQLIDGYFLYAADGSPLQPTLVMRAVQSSLVLATSATFWYFGVWARRIDPRAFAVGMVIYALDCILFVFIRDWIGLGFHLFALVMIFTGFRLASALCRAGA